MSNKLFWGLWVTVFVVASTTGYALGIKHGRAQVHFNEVSCLDHPFQADMVLCKKLRETIILETPQ